jgi:hypothetical protein
LFEDCKDRLAAKIRDETKEEVGVDGFGEEEENEWTREAGDALSLAGIYSIKENGPVCTKVGKD